jgi:hypothetical protein
LAEGCGPLIRAARMRDGFGERRKLSLDIASGQLEKQGRATIEFGTCITCARMKCCGISL